MKNDTRRREPLHCENCLADVTDQLQYCHRCNTEIKNPLTEHDIIHGPPLHGWRGDPLPLPPLWSQGKLSCLIAGDPTRILIAKLLVHGTVFLLLLTGIGLFGWVAMKFWPELRLRRQTQIVGFLIWSTLGLILGYGAIGVRINRWLFPNHCKLPQHLR